VYNSHLKSKYSRFNPVTQPTEYAADQEKSAARRLEQVEKTIEIVKSSRNVNRDNFVIVGDMNDTPDSAPLKPFLKNNNVLKLTSALDTIAQTNTDPNSMQRRKRDTHKWTRREGGATVTTIARSTIYSAQKPFGKNLPVRSKSSNGATRVVPIIT
jgi:predicted extracellular nuclease